MPDNVTLDPPITNIERLLAKAAGMEGVNVDDPETRIERYLKAICDRLDNGGGGGSQLPDPTENDVGKVATVVNNSGTYEYGLETPSSGGGVLVVTVTDGTLDKTWQEIYDAAENGIPTALRFIEENNIIYNWLSSVFKESEDAFHVDFGAEDVNFEEYTSDSASGYPSSQS